MALTAQTLRRLDVYDAPACAGGVRLGVVRDRTTLTARAVVAEEHVLNLTVPLVSSGAALLTEGRILRVEQDDDVWDEWVIQEVVRNTQQQLVFVMAMDLSVLLSKSGVIAETDAFGVIRYNIDRTGLTPTQFITLYILPFCPSWVSLGTIEPTETLDFGVNNQNPLAALKSLAQSTATEFQLRRDGTTGYLIDLVDAIGSAAPVADLREKKNLPDTLQKRSMLEQYTRIVPLGEEIEGIRGTMSRAVWKVFAVSSNTITLVDPSGGPGPLLEDDQLNGYYLRKPNGTLTLVNDSTAITQQVVVADGSGLAVNDLVQFRLNSSGHDLTFMRSPSAEAEFGALWGGLELDDIPSAHNLIPNPVCRDWAATELPTGWTKLGTPTITKQTAAPYVENVNAIKVQSTTDGHGVRSPSGKFVGLNAGNPHVAFYARVWLVSGMVRIEARVTPGDVIRPELPVRATPETLGQYTTIGMAGENFFELSPTDVELQIVQHGDTAAEFYVQFVQITESAGFLPAVEGSSGTKLWQAANEQLQKVAEPLASYESAVADLARVYPEIWGEDSALVLGGQVRLTESRLDISGGTTRVIEIQRDYLVPAATQITLSSRPEDMSAELRYRRNRRPSSSPGTGTGGATPQLSWLEGTVRVDDVLVEGAVDDGGQSLRYRIDEGSWTTINVGSDKSFTFTFDLADGQLATLQVQVYAGLNATGTAGIVYTQDFIRFPRTNVEFQNRTPDGESNVGVIRASFTTIPTIPQAAGVNITGTATGVTSTSLTNSGAAWTVDQFAANAELFRVYYVRITSGPFLNRTARILENTGTVLTLSDEWDVTGTPTYEILQGGTRYRRYANTGEPPATTSGFLPVFGTIYLDTSPEGDVFEFFTEINRMPPEPTRRVLKDADTLPEILTLDAIEFAANLLQVDATFDDDAKKWQLFVKKGGWPTLEGTETGTPDPSYMRVDDFTYIPSLRMTVSNGTWYLVGMAISSDGTPGPSRTLSVVIDGVADGALRNPVAVKHDDGTTAYYNKISWNHSGAVANSGTAHTVKIYAYRDDLGPSSEVELTAAVTRYPYQQTDADFNNANDINLVDGEGSWLHQVGVRGTISTGIWRVWRYTIELYEGLTLVQTLTCQAGDYFTRDIPSFGTDLSVSVIGGGTCAGPNVKGNYYPSKSYLYLLSYGIATPNEADYYLVLDVARDAAGTDWVTWGTIPQTFHTFSYGTGAVANGSVNPRTEYHRFRLRLVRIADSVTIATSSASAQDSALVGDCGADDVP